MKGSRYGIGTDSPHLPQSDEGDFMQSSTGKFSSPSPFVMPWTTPELCPKFGETKSTSLMMGDFTFIQLGRLTTLPDEKRDIYTREIELPRRQTVKTRQKWTLHPSILLDHVDMGQPARKSFCDLSEPPTSSLCHSGSGS